MGLGGAATTALRLGCLGAWTQGRPRSSANPGLGGQNAVGVRAGRGFCRPCRGWVFMGGRNPALTRWAIV